MLDEQVFREIDALELEKRAIVRLLQDGFAAVSPSAKPEWLIRLRATSSGLRIETVGLNSTLEREVATAGVPLPELHLEIVQKIVELLRKTTEAPRPRAAASAPAPAQVVQLAPAPPPERRRRFRLALGGGIVRAGSTDPLALGSFSSAVGPVDLVVAGALSPASNQAVSVLGWRAQAGIGWHTDPVRRVGAQAAALVGVEGHHFRLSDPEAQDRAGSRTGFVASVPLAVTLRLGEAARVGILAGPVAGTARTHVLDGRAVWRRT